VDWLCRVFGFTETLRWTLPDGKVGHSELELENGLVMVALGPDGFCMPAQPTNYSVQIIFFVSDVEEHFRRSKLQDVRIVSEPADKPWGLRQYIALDLEGHGWEFTQHLRDVSPASWGAKQMV